MSSDATRRAAPPSTASSRPSPGRLLTPIRTAAGRSHRWPRSARLVVGRLELAHNDIYVLSSSDGSNLTRLTTNPLGGNDGHWRLIPQRHRIVFLRTVQNDDGVGLFGFAWQQWQRSRFVRVR